MSSTDTVLIVDFGSQVTQLIARRVREAGVHSEIVPFQKAEEAFDRVKPRAVILSGGPASTAEIGSPRAPQIVFESDVPVLGICYGQMAMCVQMGGVAESSDHREFGRAFVEIDKECPLFEGLWAPGQRHQVWMSHGDRVVSLPDGFEVFGRSDGAPFAVFGNVERKMYGLMFHPEVVHTPDGAQLLANFVRNIAGIESTWTMAAYRERAVEQIREQVGDGKVICALSARSSPASSSIMA
jgi:GMP synthase (glutamine-hydrolysing)